MLTSPGRPPLTLALTGDVMLGRLVNESIARRGFAHPWGGLLGDLKAADLLARGGPSSGGIATDIDERLLERARAARYRISSPRELPLLARRGRSNGSRAANVAGRSGRTREP